VTSEECTDEEKIFGSGKARLIRTPLWLSGESHSIRPCSIDSKRNGTQPLAERARHKITSCSEQRDGGFAEGSRDQTQDTQGHDPDAPDTRQDTPERGAHGRGHLAGD